MIYMETKWSKVIIHASAFFAPFLVPILFFLISTDEEVKGISIQALLFQIVMWVLIAIAGILSFVLIGLPFLLIFGIMTFIVPIIGIVKAISDEPWRYPIVGRWV
ncbi:putative membrane protein [Lysinibacillus parviboronicapiens]|uniref:Membrane protein n=2 Tax=Lysinibacillus parviboronicapiens TaxID=436516 RepID=A0ABV2PLT1_9BACI